MRGYSVKIRGIVEVKGKGPMETYFVLGRHTSRSLGFARQSSQYNSLAAVVYALAQQRKKQTNSTGDVENFTLLDDFTLEYFQEGV